MLVASLDRVLVAIQQLDQVIQQNASASEEMASTSEELASQAEHLLSTMSFFRTNGNGGYHQIGTAAKQKTTHRITHIPGREGKTSVPSRGVSLEMADQRDKHDDDFERF